MLVRTDGNAVPGAAGPFWRTPSLLPSYPRDTSPADLPDSQGNRSLGRHSNSSHTEVAKGNSLAGEHGTEHQLRPTAPLSGNARDHRVVTSV